MRHERLQSLSSGEFKRLTGVSGEFKRLTGVSRSTFSRMVSIVQQQKVANKKYKLGRKPRLGVEYTLPGPRQQMSC